MRPQKAYDMVNEQCEIDDKLFIQKYKKKFIDIDCPNYGKIGQVAFIKYG